MANQTFGQYWTRKCQSVLQCAHPSLASKVLAYKTFLRPILLYEWFEGHEDYMKQLEIEALALIFGTNNEKVLYKNYTDVDVTCYLKVRELKWKRATDGSTQEHAKSLIKSSFASKTDPIPYFIRALDKQELCTACGRVKYRENNSSLGCQCTLTDVKSLLDGCEKLKGLNVTSVGGTVVDDHNCDVLLPKQVFAEEPIFKYPLADSKKIYTIIMLDPDAPPQTEGEFYLHTLKSNVPGLALKKMNDGTRNVGIDFRAYKPPTPPRGSGVHRYLCLLFEQGDGNNFLPLVPTSRSRFKLAEWLRGKNLCGPVAGTQFRALY